MDRYRRLAFVVALRAGVLVFDQLLSLSNPVAKFFD
jgi:hypothetical protein